MNKNNFFVKFAHFYLLNFTDIKITMIEMWNDIVEHFESFLKFLINIIVRPIALVLIIISIIFPLKQIIGVFLFQYLTIEELTELYAENKKGGYFSKREIRKHKEKITQEKIKNNS
jgi:hypothetical protein